MAFPWPSLPADIHLLILDEISGQKYRGWAQYAAVCREWQAVLEPKNFSQLIVKPSCLEELETLVIRQRPLVQHICLNIDLPRYTCRSCKQSATMSSRTFTIFRRAITRLFSILSTWQPTGRLTLELNASSPSDSQHWFKNYCFGPGHEDTSDWTQEEKAIKWHDPKHGWVDGQQVRTPDPSAILRLFSPLCLKVPQTLPVIHAVTCFCIRRQLRHEMHPEVLEGLWEKLPRLESIVYERWPAPELYHMRSGIISTFNPISYFPSNIFIALAYLLEQSVPKHVKRVSIFEDFNHQLTQALHDDYVQYFDPEIPAEFPDCDFLLARAFDAKSHHLEHLSISYIIDAQQFFTSSQKKPCTWYLLQSLTFTSSTLAQTAPYKNVYALLQDASSVALKMPQLQTMVLWNSERGHACAVVYQRYSVSTIATLTWRGTWDLEFSDDVVASWKKVAPDPCYLRLEKEALGDVEIRSHGDAIHHLRLPKGVVDAESLRQIRYEGNDGAWSREDE